MNGVITRFRIMAIWAGVMSLLLVVYLYASKIPTYPDESSLMSALSGYTIVHGFTYPIYLLAALHLCFMKRKSLISTCPILISWHLASCLNLDRALGWLKGNL